MYHTVNQNILPKKRLSTLQKKFISMMPNSVPSKAIIIRIILQKVYKQLRTAYM